MPKASAFFAILVLLLAANTSTAQSLEPSTQVTAVIRCDDAGMSHAVNMAIKEVAESGLPFSTSVMTACSWFTEAVEILNKYPHVSVGIHLMLNAEWKEMRWGPVLGSAAVPSLVDSLGNFFPSRALLMANKPKLDEVEKELRAQIHKAFKAGLKPDYVDYHMGAAVGTPELRAIVEKLAAEFGLGISRYFGEQDAPGLYFAPLGAKTDTLVAVAKRLPVGVRNLLVIHVGQETPELNALTDLNVGGLPEMSRHRNEERKALLSTEFRAALTTRGAHLITYRDLVKMDGLAGMKKPGQ
jgi:predicted glycoside hydrolase/deacetylase ChbG (UPF0249 family)